MLFLKRPEFILTLSDNYDFIIGFTKNNYEEGHIGVQDDPGAATVKGSRFKTTIRFHQG